MYFCFVLYSACTTFAICERRRRLNNKNKKNVFLFCIVFGLHYLCNLRT